MDQQPSVPLGDRTFLLGSDPYPVVCTYNRDLRPPIVHCCCRMVAGMVYWDMYMNIGHHFTLTTRIYVYIIIYKPITLQHPS